MMRNHKHELFPVQLGNRLMFDVDQSMTTTFTSKSFEVSGARGFAVQFYWTDAVTPIGDVYLSGSNDDITFTQINDSILSVSGDSGSCLINYDWPRFQFVKLTYDPTSGTGGSANAKINTKV